MGDVCQYEYIGIIRGKGGLTNDDSWKVHSYNRQEDDSRNVLHLNRQTPSTWPRNGI
jgi:hypothetical protein